jgi:hypothetical protein
MHAGENLWFLKPGNFNRGRGVIVFRTLPQLLNLIEEYADLGNKPPPLREILLTQQQREDTTSL